MVVRRGERLLWIGDLKKKAQIMYLSLKNANACGYSLCRDLLDDNVFCVYSDRIFGCLNILDISLVQIFADLS